MKRESVSGLSGMTGLDRVTVKKKIAHLEWVKEGRSHMYRVDEALRAIYLGDKQFNTDEERGRLTHHQANNEMLREMERKGELIHADKVLAHWQDMIGASRARFLAIPTKLAPLVATLDDASKIEKMIRTEVHDALDELSGSGIPTDVGKRVSSISRGMEKPAGPDVESVGGKGA